MEGGAGNCAKKRDEQESAKTSQEAMTEKGDCGADGDRKGDKRNSCEEPEIASPEEDAKSAEKTQSATCRNNSDIKDRMSEFPDGNEYKETAKSRSNECIVKEKSYEEPNAKKDSKPAKRRSSLESGGEGGAGDGGCLRRHKSLDGADQTNLQKSDIEGKEKDKKDPRLERRIRNKDRPAMEIYRPGMGKFSKQRLEREKSSNDERASLSQSPTPSPACGAAGKPGKTAAEVRSMTFKRSVSRDMP